MQELSTIVFEDLQHYKVLGRTSNKRSPLTLFWTGSGLLLNCKASELWIEVEADYELYEPWISILVNGAPVSRQMVSKGRLWICMFRGMNKAVIKEVRLVKEVQAMSADESHCLQIHAVRTDGEFLPVEERKLKIEVIGDSITSGEGTVGAQKEEDWISMIFGSVNTYSSIVANQLNAELRILSQSGWGVLSSWDNNPYMTLPSIYDKICGLAKGTKNEALGAGEPNDFAAWQPDVIIVNLGTNDAGAFDNSEWKNEVTGESFKQYKDADGSFHPECLKRFEEHVIMFLSDLRKYNPDSSIIWCYGMLGNPIMPSIQQAITVYKEASKDNNVTFVELPDTTAEGTGSRSHPGVLSHQKAADVLVGKIRELL